MSLHVENLHKSYSQGTQNLEILRGLNLEVKTGEVVAVVGKSGSGKSTLLSLLAGLDSPDSGKISLANASIEKLSQDELSQWRGKNVGIVFQQFHLMAHLTALENVLFPMEILGQDNPSRAEALLADLGLGARMHHLPRELSGGECQRVAIARALSTKPNLLLADEPSGNLDTDTGEQVMNSFFQQVRKSNTTTMLVTHNRELADRCDRKLILHHGILSS